MRPTDVPDTGTAHSHYVRFNLMLGAQACFAISYGQIPTRILPDGVKTTAVSRLRLAQMLSDAFCKNTIWTLFVGRTKSWRMGTSFSQSDNLSRYFLRPTIVASLITLVR